MIKIILWAVALANLAFVLLLCRKCRQRLKRSPKKSGYTPDNLLTEINKKMSTEIRKSADRDWILSNIQKSRTVFQLKCCFRLIDLFKVRYDDAYEDIDQMMEKLLERQSQLEIFY